MDFEQYQRGEDSYRFCLTTCGLIGFIVFFLGSFCAFIVAGELESESHYELTVILGAVMLFITTVFFCCVVRGSKRIIALRNPSETMELEPLVSRQLPELPNEPLPEPQQEFHWPSGDSEGTVDGESDPEIVELRKMAKYGLPAEGKEPTAGTSGNSQARDSKSIGGSCVDIQLDSAKAGPSKVAGRNSELIESRSPLDGMFPVSAMDSTLEKSASAEKKQTENVSASLVKLSMSDSEKKATEMVKERSTSAYSEGQSCKQQAETSKDAKDVKSSKSE